MRNNKAILKLVSSSSDYILWVGLIRSNLTNEDLFNAQALVAVSEFCNESNKVGDAE